LEQPLLVVLEQVQQLDTELVVALAVQITLHLD
jgi:hypothetical protein